MADELALQIFRDNVQGIASAMRNVPSTLGQFTLRHFFTPKSEKYGCCIYGREIFLPKGNLVIGKIHKHWCINFVMTGRVRMGTPDGPKFVEAPDMFVSAPGMQRIGIIEEDCLWATCHMTEHLGEENLDKIEDELIAKDYHDFDLVGKFDCLGLENK